MRETDAWRALFPEIEFVKARYLRDHAAVLDAFCERVGELDAGAAGDELPALQVPHADHRLRRRRRRAADRAITITSAASASIITAPRTTIHHTTADVATRSTFVIVDWSAANVPQHRPRQHLDLPAWARTAKTLENPPTRHAAKALLGDMARRRRGARRARPGRLRFPVRLSDRVCRPARPCRAAVARGLGRDRRARRGRREQPQQPLRGRRRVQPARSPAGAFPFWGCPRGRGTEFLGPRHHRRHDDRRARRAPADRLLDADRAAVLEARLVPARSAARC